MAPDLHAKMLALEDFLNEPKRSPDIEPMDVRDFRHEAYRVWSPLCRLLMAQSRAPEAAKRDASGALYDALEALFADYKQLADSGDAGNWSLEDMDVGKQALAALALARGDQPTPLREGEL